MMSDAGSDKSNSGESPAAESAKATETKRVIKIGSQREGHGPVVPQEPERPKIDGAEAQSWDPPAPATPAGSAPPSSEPEPERSDAPAEATPVPVPEAVAISSADEDAAAAVQPESTATDGKKSFPPPRVQRLSAELQDEIDAALAGVSMDDLLGGGAASGAKANEPEVEKRYRATVVKVHREDVFFSLPGHHEGVTSLRQFAENPEPGALVEVIVKRLNAEDGLYELALPGASIDIQDWSDISEGTVVEAMVKGHNKGGLECEVSGIRGFMPVSQIDIFRVEDLEQFIGKKFNCVISEANESRGNLVLSRRAVLEREREAVRAETMGALAVGQVHEGTVRKLMDFGAFVDIGGVDGLIHVSKLSWDRIKHPSEVVEEGQKVKVVIDKIDVDTGKISLSYRDAVSEHPWQAAAKNFVEGTVVDGTVSKIMDFGAFIKIATGVEGLAHISELAHHRVTRVANVVSEGQAVSVKILSIDADAQRMSLSIKQAMAAPAIASAGKQDPAEEEPARESAVKKHQGALRGGTDKKSGGEQFGLKW